MQGTTLRATGRIVVRGFVGIAVAVLVAATPTLAGDASDLAARVEAWETAFNAGDAEAIAALYAEDSIRMPYQAPTIKGRKGIVANIGETIAGGVESIKLEMKGAETMGDLAWGNGTYALIDADGNTVQAGKWMNVSKKVGGTWLIQGDIWNTDAPE